MGYIYVIQVFQHILDGLSIYKIGMTENIKRRFKQYPKGSKLLYYNECDYYKKCEKYLISNFIEKYVQKKEYGIEYFEGDISNIINDVKNGIEKHLKNNYEPYCQNKIKKYSCDRCKKEVGDLRDFRRHINLVNDCANNCVAYCTICDKVFDKSSNLTRHIITIHKNKEIDNKFLNIKKEDKMINYFRNENIECFNNTNIIEILSLDNPIIELLKLMYFNKSYKCNLNFHFITIIKHKYVVYKKTEKEWDIIKTDIFIDNVLDNILNKLKIVINNDSLINNIKEKYVDKNSVIYKLYKEKFTLLLITYQEYIIQLKYEEIKYLKDSIKNQEQLKLAKDEYIKKQPGRPKNIKT